MRCSGGKTFAVFRVRRRMLDILGSESRDVFCVCNHGLRVLRRGSRCRPNEHCRSRDQQNRR